MNTNITLLQQARELIAQAEQVQSERRSYDRTAYHAVNVKRYHDYINDDERARIAHNAAAAYSLDTKHEADILAYITEYAENEDAYGYFLSDAWDMLNYGASDSDVCGREHKHIKVHAYHKSPMIISCGRSGGWACFNSDLERNLEALYDAVEYYETGSYGYTESDVRDAMALVRDTLDDIAHLEAYIKQYNTNLSWSDELQFRAKERAEEIRANIKAHTTTRKAQITHRAPLAARV